MTDLTPERLAKLAELLKQNPDDAPPGPVVTTVAFKQFIALRNAAPALLAAARELHNLPAASGLCSAHQNPCHQCYSNLVERASTAERDAEQADSIAGAERRRAEKAESEVERLRAELAAFRKAAASYIQNKRDPQFTALRDLVFPLSEPSPFPQVAQASAPKCPACGDSIGDSTVTGCMRCASSRAPDNTGGGAGTYEPCLEWVFDTGSARRACSRPRGHEGAHNSRWQPDLPSGAHAGSAQNVTPVEDRTANPERSAGTAENPSVSVSSAGGGDAGEGPDLSAAAEALFDMLWLYRGYTIDSRGPIGCIHRCLREIHPASQAMLADGASVDAVRNHFWPTDENGNPLEAPQEAKPPASPRAVDPLDQPLTRRDLAVLLPESLAAWGREGNAGFASWLQLAYAGRDWPFPEESGREGA